MLTGLKIFLFGMQLDIVMYHISIDAERVHDALGQTSAPVLPIVVVGLLLRGSLDEVVALNDTLLVCQRLELGSDRHLMASSCRNLQRISRGPQLVI